MHIYKGKIFNTGSNPLFPIEFDTISIDLAYFDINGNINDAPVSLILF